MRREFSFQWHITDFCNLRCKHCYQNAFDRRNELDYSNLVNILYNITNSLKKLNINYLSINLTGGEPFLFP
ncbi:MAG: radical SAM protein, partial [Dictyoglomus sp.]